MKRSILFVLFFVLLGVAATFGTTSNAQAQGTVPPPPATKDDYAEMVEGGDTVVNFLKNDSIGDMYSAVTVGFAPDQRGWAMHPSSGTVRFVNPPVGQYSWPYTVTMFGGSSYTATINLSVMAVTPPAAPTIEHGASYRWWETATVTFTVAEGATDAYFAVSETIQDHSRSSAAVQTPVSVTEVSQVCSLAEHGGGMTCPGSGVFTMTFEVAMDSQVVWFLARAFYPGDEQAQMESYALVEQPGQADVSVSLSVDPEEFTVFQPFTVTAVFTNNGPSAVVAYMTVDLPSGQWEAYEEMRAGETRVYSFTEVIVLPTTIEASVAPMLGGYVLDYRNEDNFTSLHVAPIAYTPPEEGTVYLPFVVN